MEKKNVSLTQCEDEIEKALISLEQSGKLHEALMAYRKAEAAIEAVESSPGDLAYAQKQRVLAYCLMRQGNILRQLGQMEEAAALSQREMTAAIASNDEITLARSLLSHGTSLLASGDVEKGLKFIDKARPLFEKGTTYDHKQGAGWYWILKADLMNAGIVRGNPSDIIAACDEALTMLLPIKNWHGVARAYEALAKAHERQGEREKAAVDRKAQAKYEQLASEEE